MNSPLNARVGFRLPIRQADIRRGGLSRWWVLPSVSDLVVQHARERMPLGMITSATGVSEVEVQEIIERAFRFGHLNADEAVIYGLVQLENVV